MKKTPIIIDCDPGVDDSFAIALANSCPLFDIVAITAVEGNVPALLTRKNALCLRETLHINCAVAFGAELPLEKPYFRSATSVHGETGIGTAHMAPSTMPADERPAAELIYEEAVKHSGELVLFAIGPLTNIATCLRTHPDLPKHIKKFVIMGGGTHGNVGKVDPKAEFNIWIDPLAAKEVFAQMETCMIGINATEASALDITDFDEMIAICDGHENARFIKELAEFSRKNHFTLGYDSNIIHDALAVYSVIEPPVIGYEDYYVWVEDDATLPNEGETVIDYDGTCGKAPNCHVAMQVDRPRFIQAMKEMCRFYAQGQAK